MNKQEIEHLEYLLGKLQCEIPNRFCLIPNYIGDGVYIGVYNHDGAMKQEVNAPTLEQAINKINHE